jgi:DNA polymerase-3 subunit epsilon
MHRDRPTLGALAARAHDLLSAGGHPLAPEALIEHVFGISQSRAAARGPAAHDFWRGQLARLLADTATFSQYADGNWGLAEWGTIDVALDAMDYIVVDCETTGLNPQTQRVIEIAAIRCRGRRVVERFETLIDAERAIPQAIRQLTGITPALLQGAPRAPEAIQAFLEFVGGGLLVGHNVRFDLNFLSAEALRHHHTRLLNPSICTIRLASRLLPVLKRPNLDNLAHALDLRTQARHRAMGDAAVTQQVFWKLVELAQQRGIATQGRLQALLGPSSGSVRAVGSRGTGRLLLNPALRQGLPARPGVYLMKDERGTVIYVGKAKNLKQRIASYYAQPLGYRRKMDGLLESIRDLETIVVGSELEALIKESQLIKAYMPQFNVQQRYYRHYPFIKVEVQNPFPRVYAAREVTADGARYFGPYRSKRAVDTVIELIHQLYPIRTCTRVIQANGRHRGKPSSCLRFQLGRCLGPCMGAVTPQRYQEVIGEVMAFLSGGHQAMLRTVEDAMYRAADRQDFERAGRLRDALAQARQVIVSQELLTGAIERNNLVIVCPSVDPGAAELFGIRHGRLYEQCTLADASEDEGLARVFDFLQRLEQAAAAPLVVGQEEIDAIIIIGRWLARYGESAQVVRLPHHVSRETAQAILTTAKRVHVLVRDDDGSDLWEDQQ